MLAGGLGGCASAHMIRVPAVTTGPGCQVPVPERDVLVGVALSGGGSRAALFAAAGLEALARLRTRSGASALQLLVTFSANALAASIAGTVITRYGYPTMLSGAAVIGLVASLLFWRLLRNFETAKGS